MVKNLFSPILIIQFLPQILSYFPTTMSVLFLSLVSSLMVGTLLYFAQMRKIPVLHQFLRVLMSYMRGTPVITQLFLTYFALPVALMELTGINITRVPGMFFVTLTYSVYFGASVAENLRGSMNAVGRGQFEAAYSLGMTEFTAFRRIIFPQMIVVALPNFSNIFIRELKNTSLAFSVGVIEMVSAARNLGSVYMHNFEAYAAIAIIYYVLYIMVLQIFNFIEKKVKAHILV